MKSSNGSHPCPDIAALRGGGTRGGGERDKILRRQTGSDRVVEQSRQEIDRVARSIEREIKGRLPIGCAARRQHSANTND